MVRSTGAEYQIHFRRRDGTSTGELLLAVGRDAPHTLGAQIEDAAAHRDPRRRAAARRARSRPRATSRASSGSRAASRSTPTRSSPPRATWRCARARGRACPTTAAVERPRRARRRSRPAPPPRFDFRPSMPDVTAFPRAAWLRSVREAVRRSPTSTSATAIRAAGRCATALVDYFGRVRGLVADPGRVVITSGYSQGLEPRLPGARGRRREADRASRIPSNPEQREIARGRGSRRSACASTSTGMRVDELPPADAVLVTPAHQHPTGACSPPSAAPRCSPGCATTTRSRSRTTTTPSSATTAPAVGALQGLEPERVIYAGSASKTLAPALRLGWLVVPGAPGRADPPRRCWPTAGRRGSSSSRSPTSSRAASSTATCAACAAATAPAATRWSRRSADELPEAEIRGIAAGLHVTVRAARRRRRGRDPRRGRASGGSPSRRMRDYDVDDGRADADARLRAAARAGDPAGVRELAPDRASTSARSRRVVDVSPDERFDALYRAHYAAVLRFARRRTDPASAEDVAAETFAIAWRRLEGPAWTTRSPGST